jgi:hypothetical protein
MHRIRGAAHINSTREEVLMSHEFKCSSCGGTHVEPGSLHTAGKVHFRPAHSKFLAMHTADVEVKAHVCVDCGHVNLAADIRKLSRLVEHAKPVG